MKNEIYRLLKIFPKYCPSDIDLIFEVFAMKIDLKNPNEIAEETGITEEQVIEILFNKGYRDTIIDARIFDAIISHDLKQLVHLYNELNSLSEKHSCSIEDLLITVCPYLQKGEI